MSAPEAFTPSADSDDVTAFGATHYIILQEDDAGKFVELVNSWLAKGWRTQGGVDFTVIPVEGGYGIFRYSQAVVRP